MLIELSTRQSSLRRESALIVTILMILDLYQRLITTTYRLLHHRVGFFGLRAESIDRVPELAGVYLYGARIDGFSEIFVVAVHLRCIIDRTESNGFV